MDKPYCYGKLEKVFPKKEDGLRHTPDSCFYCSFRIKCLKAAVADGKEGIKLKEEMVDRAYTSGKLSFFQRWSQKKALCKEEKK
ncbi:MAG: hypothetical protein JRJ44_05490 [Deltaproteobacteria bacterium]|nr:hypothetical protein [Deltaproteobacteria bacterium]